MPIFNKKHKTFFVHINIKTFFLFIFFTNIKSSFSASPFIPRFYTPNEKTLDGEFCVDQYPSREVTCPLFGILIDTNTDGNFTFLNQIEIEDKCSNLGFLTCSSGTSLFPDGVCRSCPESHPSIQGSGTGDLWCENQKTGDKLTYENPFNCNGDGLIPRVKQNSYRPCIWHPDYKSANVASFVHRNNLNGELTMNACASSLFNKDFSNSLESIIVMREYTEHDFGFLQCPRKNIEYSFLGNLWIAYYSIFSVGALIILFYFFFKKYSEKNYFTLKNSIQESWTHEASMNEEFELEGLISESYDMKQIGYRNTIFGSIAFYAFWIMSWALHILMIMINIDIYGFWFKTLCPPEINESCSALGGQYSWRAGFQCAQGCLFSFRHTSGFDNYWPYNENPKGMQQVYAIICIAFLIISIWWLLLIIFYKKFYLFFSIQCNILDSSFIMCIKPKENDIRVEGENKNYIVYIFSYFENFFKKFTSIDYMTEKCDIHFDDSGERYITFQCIKYVYNKNENKFHVKSINVAKTKADLHQGISGLSSEESYMRLKLIGENKINYEVPNISVSLWNEFFSLFYLYQCIFLYIWYAFYYWLLAVIVTIVIVVTGIFSTFVKRSSQKMLKSMSENHTRLKVLRDNKWITISSHMIVPGDIIAIESGNFIVCDCVLVKGRSVLNESSLTGEPTPVPKISVPNTSDQFGKSTEDMKFTLLSGTVVESVTAHNNDYALAFVIATGINTKQGQLMRTMLFPPRLRFKFDDHFIVVFTTLFIFGIINITIIAYLMHWIYTSIFYGFFTISNAFNPLIPAMFTSSQAYCSSQLKKRNIFCTEISRIFVAAKIKIFCFDKTGTLTTQGMKYHGYCDISSNILSYQQPSHSNNIIRAFLGCCHELEFVKNDKSGVDPLGNEVDTAMFEISDFEFVQSENNSTVIKDIINQKIYKIHRIFEFSRETMMMSAIIEDQATKSLFIYTKGSYERVVASSKHETIPKNINTITTQYAMAGHYILGIGMKELSSNINILELTREEAESNLNFIGLLHFKNELKPDTRDVIEHVKSGNIQCIMITGDNLYTACSIAKESGLSSSPTVIIGDVPEFSEVVVWRNLENLEQVSILPFLENSKVEDFDLALSNKAFDLLRITPLKHFLELSGSKNINDYPDTDAMHYLSKYTRIFARMKPDQKVEAVRMNMEVAVTGMCGDGANDAAALRLAHCGIAIASGGAKATIVAPFSSPNHSLSVVTDVLRYGRGTLATAIFSYKRLLLEGLTIVFLKMINYHSSLQFSEVSWIFCDGFINVVMMILMLYSKPADRLTPKRPTSSLLGLEVFFSTLSQLLIAFFTLLTVIFVLFKQKFVECRNFDSSMVNLTQWWTMSDSYESTALSVITLFILINHAFVFNLGYDYRKAWYRNYSLLIYWALLFSLFTTILFSNPNVINCIFRISCGDHSLLERWNSLNLISYTGNVPLVPPGCPCSEQIGYVDDPEYTCDNEYINCNQERYNNTFHHTIFPNYFRVTLFLIMLGGFLISIIFEWFIVYGPVRIYLRKQKFNKRNKANSNKLNKMIS